MARNLRVRTLRSPMGWHSAAPSRSTTSCAHLQELRGPLGGGLQGRQRRGDVGQGHFLPAQGTQPSAAGRSEQLYQIFASQEAAGHAPRPNSGRWLSSSGPPPPARPLTKGVTAGATHCRPGGQPGRGHINPGPWVVGVACQGHRAVEVEASGSGHCRPVLCNGLPAGGGRVRH